MGEILCEGFTFYNNFDSANVAKVEYVPLEESTVFTNSKTSSQSKTNSVEIPDIEFNLWTKPDCGGTEFENGNRTWFYFGMKASSSSMMVRLNLIDINRQAKMYSQGMAPVYKILPAKPNWERIRDKPSYTMADDIFTLSFKHKTPENVTHTTYFAFTYPFTYTDLQRMMVNIDAKYLNWNPIGDDEVYYNRECVCNSLEGRRVDLITITSFHGLTSEREPRLKKLFPESNVPRSYKFKGKKVIFVSARVHPGETPSSFVFNGLLQLLLNREDPVALVLRRLYVFKMIPMLNPDGVARGHYRTDTRGMNLNRMYLNPSFTLHPSIYAARALIRYYHYGCEKPDLITKCENCIDIPTDSTLTDDECIQPNDVISNKVSNMTLEEKKNSPWCIKCKSSISKFEETMPGISSIIPTFTNHSEHLGKNLCRNCGAHIDSSSSSDLVTEVKVGCHGDINQNESEIFLYIDMHGHASKKGIFMYGNHFDDAERNVECMLLPKLMSINNHNFHFTACNFTERNMYLKDKRDGLSREGSGRVSVLKLTGLVKSYTLECNYNTGRLVNVLPPSIKEHQNRVHTLPIPPKYNPAVFEEVGRALGASILDLTGQNPCTRLPHSEFHSLGGLQDWIRVSCVPELGETRPGIQRHKLRNSTSVSAQAKPRGMLIRSRQTKKIGARKLSKSRCLTMPAICKENIGLGGNDSIHKMQPSSSSDVQKVVPKSVKINKSISLFKNKARNKEGSLKCKSSGDKQRTKSRQKLATPQKIRLDLTNKLKNMKQDQMRDVKSKEDIDDVELSELCFFKNADCKTVLAKYKSPRSNKQDYEDNLLVSWNAASNAKAQIYTQKSKVGVPIINTKLLQEPCTSGKQGNIRVHNFSKTASMPNSARNKNKSTLRRVGSGTESTSGKIEKLKKKKKLIVK